MSSIVTHRKCSGEEWSSSYYERFGGKWRVHFSFSYLHFMETSIKDVKKWRYYQRWCHHIVTHNKWTLFELCLSYCMQCVNNIQVKCSFTLSIWASYLCFLLSKIVQRKNVYENTETSTSPPLYRSQNFGIVTTLIKRIYTNRIECCVLSVSFEIHKMFNCVVFLN